MKQIRTLAKILKENSFNVTRIICFFVVLYEYFIILINIKLPILGIKGIKVYVLIILSDFWVTISLFTSKIILIYTKKRI